MSDFFKLVNQRESCRDFNDKPVSKEQLIRCIETARLAPSATNSQPWHFVVVNNKATSLAVAKLTQGMGMNKFTDAAPSFIIVCEEKVNMTSKVGGMIKDQPFSSIDIGIATAHLCYAATEQALSSCILGWFDEKKIIQLLALPKNKRIRLVIAVGHATENPLGKKIRKSLDNIMDYID